jgi:uncharacterized membrane protein
VDNTVNSLSPAVNDPTTAIVATERLAELVQRHGQRRPPRFVQRGDERGSVIASRTGFAQIVALAFDQIRRYGADNPSFIIRLIGTLGRLGARVPEDIRRPVLRQIALARKGGEGRAALVSDQRAIRRAAAEAARLVRTAAFALLAFIP